MDRTPIVGDAFVATAQEPASAAPMRETEIHGRPRYLAIDGEAALEPDRVVTGLGRPLQGPEMRRLTQDFDSLAVPEQGRDLERPARAEDGSAYREP